jgi:hypothetical protein
MKEESNLDLRDEMVSNTGKTEVDDAGAGRAAHGL